ncbi:MAG: TlpA disulfide reductase family protein [Gammaproteobacteria bacterium]
MENDEIGRVRLSMVAITGICRSTRLACCALITAGALTACSPPVDSPDPNLVPNGVWRGEIEQFGRALPFTFTVDGSGNSLQVSYRNGDEQVAVERVSYDPTTQALELWFPSYSSGLIATVDGTRMSGETFLNRRNQIHRLPFTAQHGLEYRFFEQAADDYVDLSGRWEVLIDMPKFELKQNGVASFQQRGPYITGTVNTEVGDYRFLTGEVRGRDLYLSSFDGNGTQLWLASLGQDGILRGSFDTVTYQRAEWKAKPNPDAELNDPMSLTWIKQPQNRLAFTFPDLDGNPVSLADEQFRGKVVLVVVAGSWCPTCHDEASFMAPYYKNNKDRGLEVVYLMFEYSDRFEEVEDQVRAFRSRYDIEHEMLFAGDASRTTRNDILPMLNGIIAFPTTIFVDRKGEVRRIHTAFPGPATGEPHEEYKRELRAFVDALLAETA